MIATTASVIPAERLAEHTRIDQLELAMLTQAGHAVIDLPLTHRFTPGIYIREIFMPAGTLATSKIHRVEHAYVVQRGRVSVYIPGRAVEHITAPHFGITRAGTRRVLLVHEDCVWITFHPNVDDTHDLALIESRLIERRELTEGHTSYEMYSALLDRASMPCAAREMPEVTA